MATLSLINFPKYSESKEFLKIGRSEVCVWGGGAKGETIKLSRSVYLYTEPKSSNKIKQSSYIFFFYQYSF